MINNKTFEHRPIAQLISLIKSSFRKFDQEGLIDETSIVKTVLWCNDQLGIGIREVKQCVVPVSNFRATLPVNFEKLYYACALSATNTIVTDWKDPFDNNFDRSVIYEAEIQRDELGGSDNYGVIIKREGPKVIQEFRNFMNLSISAGSLDLCHSDCPNNRIRGKYQIEIKDGEIITQFKKGEIYLMYISTMQDNDGNLLFPFHPLITPWYEWCAKEQVITDAMMNSDGRMDELNTLRTIAIQEKTKAWLTAFNFTTDKGFGEYQKDRKKRELQWYSQYFKYFR